MSFAKDSDSDEVAVGKLIQGIIDLTELLNIPKLKDLAGVKKEDFPSIVRLAMENNSSSSNVRLITEADYMQILEQAYFNHVDRNWNSEVESLN
jgi:alcohol dehydrogenase